MGIVSINVTWSGAKVEDQSETGQVLTRNITELWDVLVDDPINDTKESIMESDLIPKAGISVHPSNFWLRCTGVSPERTSLIRYMVSITYTATFQPGSSGAAGSPFDVPPDIEFDFIVSNEAIDRDINGNGLHTIVGEAFDPPIGEEIYTPVLRVTRNVPLYDPSTAVAFSNKINSAPFLNQPTGSVRSGGIKGKQIISEGWVYYTVSAEFFFRGAAPGSTVDKAWWYRQIAQGFLVKKSGKVIPGVDEHGNETTVPVRHNKTTGAQLAITDPAQFYEFQLKGTADFNQLGLI